MRDSAFDHVDVVRPVARRQVGLARCRNVRLTGAAKVPAAAHLHRVHSLHLASSLIDVRLPALNALCLIAAQPALDLGEAEIRGLHPCFAGALGHDDADLHGTDS